MVVLHKQKRGFVSRWVTGDKILLPNNTLGTVVEYDGYSSAYKIEANGAETWWSEYTLDNANPPCQCGAKYNRGFETYHSYWCSAFRNITKE